MRRGQRWLTGIFVAVIGLVFAAFIGLGGPLSRSSGSSGAVVQLDDRGIGIAEFERVREQQLQRLQETLGDQFDAKTVSAFLDSQTLRLLVDGMVLAHSAREFGLRVSKQEIQDAVRELPGFRDEAGRFDQESFISWVEWSYGSQRAFADALRDELLKRKLARTLYGLAEVSEGEARSAALQRMEEVQIAFVVLDAEDLPPGVELSEDEVREYSEGHEEEIQALYDGRIDQFRVPEKVKARHILLRVEKDAPAEEVEEVRTRAESALARIREGASLEDVALELSEDPGSREQGGDLGFIARGETNPVLEEAVFSQELGVVGDLVRSDSGFHIVRAEERSEAGSRPFEEMRLELGREGAERSAAGRRAQELADRLSTAIREGSSLEDAARAEELTLQRSAMLRRRSDGFIPNLGASPEMLATAFALDLEHSSSPRVFSVDGKLALVQLLDRKQIDPEALESAVAVERERLLEIERNAMIQDWIDGLRDTLVAERRLVVHSDLVTGGR
jgi:peptidyl-prolyl cis-trans isomerase D